MCFFSPPKPNIPTPPDPNAAADAAAEAEMQRRREAQGYGSTIFGGANPAQPTLGRKVLFGQ